MREMKDSGTVWLGTIPANWDIARIGSFYRLRNTKVSDTDYPPLSVTNKGVVPQLETAAKTNAHDDRKLVKKGDFAINSRSDRRGSCGIAPCDGSVSLINTILSPMGEMNPRYYDWLFHTIEFGDEFYKCGHGIVDDLWTTGWQDMKKIRIPYPSLAEQEKIADVLDSQCSDIDAISADIQKEIEILEQFKRSIITEAVTKGLNPDAEMKDSGIEWVGNIPAHWDAIPIRYLFAECRLKNTLNQEKTALKFTYGTIIKKTNFDSDSDEYVANTMTNYTVVNPGTIMINGLNLNYDFVSQRVGLVKDRGAITSAYLAIAPGNRVVSEYANYQLKSWDYAKAFHNMGTGVRKTLDFSELGKKYFVTPSIEEQSEIVTFLDSKCKEIESIIESKKQQLTVIDSYKKSLIYEYVTGKKEAPLYES